MHNNIYSSELFEFYIDSISKSLTSEDVLKKSTYIQEWLEWLKKRNEISQNQYNESLTKIHTVGKKRIESLNRGFLKKEKKSNIYHYVSKYFFNILLILTLIITLYNSYRNLNFRYFSSKSSTNRTLPYTGSLIDNRGNAVTSKKDITFRIYQNETGGVPLYTGSCRGQDGITPDYKGNFTIVIGSDCNMSPITDELLTMSSNVYLGVQIGSGSELKPRKKITTAGYSQDAELLNGLERGTNKNMVPYIDRNSRMKIDAPNPILDSSEGTFTIQGKNITLKTTDIQNPSILLQPNVNGNTIVATGHLGIGQFNPKYTLSAMDGEPFSAVGSIKNIATEDDSSTSVLKLHLGTPDIGTNAHFIEFYAGADKNNDGTKVGSISINNGGVVYQTTDADFAEYFEVSEADHQPGTIMSISKEGIRKSRNGEKIIGVISETAGFIGNKKDFSNQENVLIALEGQVEVFVTTINGPIQIGDSISSSDIPGWGSRSLNDTYILGYALETTENPGKRIVCPNMKSNERDSRNSNLDCYRIRILLTR